MKNIKFEMRFLNLNVLHACFNSLKLSTTPISTLVKFMRLNGEISFK